MTIHFSHFPISAYSLQIHNLIWCWYVMLCPIWCNLPNLKNTKNTHGGALLKPATCNFTKSNIPLRVFVMFFKLRKWYQIAQKRLIFLSQSLEYNKKMTYLRLRITQGKWLWTALYFTINHTASKEPSFWVSAYSEVYKLFYFYPN